MKPGKRFMSQIGAAAATASLVLLQGCSSTNHIATFDAGKLSGVTDRAYSVRVSRDADGCLVAESAEVAGKILLAVPAEVKQTQEKVTWGTSELQVGKDAWVGRVAVGVSEAKASYGAAIPDKCSSYQEVWLVPSVAK